MVKIRRRRHYVTTDSNHNYRRYPNLVKGVTVTAPNRVWVSDITYVETEEGVYYLSLVTDLYSHKIVGWSLGPTLDTAYPLEALRMALATLPEGDAPYLIHHSGRGSQYCSHAYVDTLKGRRIQISMTQSGDPLESAGEILGRSLPIEKKCVILHRQKRITTVYATSDEKSSGEKKSQWLFDSEAVNKKPRLDFAKREVIRDCPPVMKNRVTI